LEAETDVNRGILDLRGPANRPKVEVTARALHLSHIHQMSQVIPQGLAPLTGSPKEVSAMSNSSYSILKRFVAAGAAILLALSLGEVFLHLQPFVSLKYAENTVNPEPRISFEHHHNAYHIPQVQNATLGPGCDNQGKRLKLLFLGDSWMELTDGIPRGAAESLLEQGPKDLCVQIINAGTTSFSPSLMLVKGENLIREHSPDFVIANIDETDLMDEYLRYRKTTLRDRAGRIERVVPNVVDLAYLYERSALNQQPVYTLRLIEQIYYDKVLLPRLRREFFGVEMDIGSYELIMSPQLSHNPRTSHAKEIEYFKQVLREMIDRLTAKLPPNGLLLTHHPHLLHLPQGDKPARYNTIVSDVVLEETQTARAPTVNFYDAQRDLRELYGDNPESFFTPGDPFSHLTPDGYRRYGRFIGRTLQPLVARALQ
jgi:hypothetical protein